MKTVSNEFKKELTTMGRQYKNKIGIYGNGHLATQDNKLILTQDNMMLVVENSINKILEDDMLFNINLVRKGKILATNMKELDFESYEDIDVGSIVSYQFGLKVDFENDEYEWINYGKYIIYSKEFNEDTKTYSYVCYDYMLKTMIKIDNRSIFQNVSIQTAIINIAEKFGLSISLDTTEYPNLLKIINKDAFNNIDATYRDVLDMICQALGTTMITNNDELILKSLKTNPVDTIDKTFIKDTNVSFGKKYGPINSLVISRSGQTDNIYRQDTQSIEQNGLTEFKINDNLILLYNDREQYIDNIFNQINGVEYYINDFSSTGIGYIEFLDFYNIDIDDNIYKCLMLDSSFKVKNGISEDINTEEPEETTTDYMTAGKTDKEVSFIVDKQRGEISTKVSQDEMESAINQTATQINLEVAKKVGNDEVISRINQSAEAITINANKISLAGKELDLTSDNITISSNKFEVDKNGNVECSSIDITGGTLEIGDKFEVDQYGNVDCANINITGGTMDITNNRNVDIITITNPRYGIETTMDGGLIHVESTGGTNTELNHTGLLATDGSYQGWYSSDEMELTHGNDETWIKADRVRSPSIAEWSLEEKKKNFELYNDALNEIKKIDIYKYNLKSEEDSAKKRLGFVIGNNYNYSQLITTNDNECAEIYSMASLCLEAIKEQQQIIEELQEKVNKLEEEK